MKEVGRILVVDDDDGNREALDEILSLSGYSVETAVSVASATAMLATSKYGVLITDTYLPDGTGFDVIKAAMAQGAARVVFQMSGSGQRDLPTRANRAGAAGFFKKPINPSALLAAIAKALGNASITLPA